jgi:hypothetical protein
MGLVTRLRGKPTFGIGRHVTTPAHARRMLARALQRQEARLERAQSSAIDVQLLGQATPATDWPKLLAYWQRRNPSGVAAWPPQLATGTYALNLWPLRAGRLARPAAHSDVRQRQPKKLLCTPGLTVFDTSRGNDAQTALAVVCTSWLEDVGMTDFQALRLAPPLLEVWAYAGRLASRDMVTFDLEWSLPAL